MEKDYSDLEVLFHQIMANMKSSYPLWEEMVARATKLHAALRYTVAATSAFLESFQRLNDFATTSKGGTKDIGSSLTRLCFRQKSIENRLKAFTNELMESLVIPLQEQIDDWKKTAVHLDKDHAHDYKKAVHTVKKASSDTVRLQKKANKGKQDAQCQLQSALQDFNAKRSALETMERNAVKSAFVEERRRFCIFIKCLQPVMEHEMSMLSEVTHLQDVVANLCTLSQDPSCLPDSAEEAISDALHDVVQPPATLEQKMHRTVRETSESDILSDKSASSSTGSVQLSTDSVAASTDSVTARMEIPPSATSNVVKIADIPLPDNRPHTISSAVYQPPVRPLIIRDTFEPPTVITTVSSGPPDNVADIYSRPSLMSRDSRNTVLVAVATPTVPVITSSVPGDDHTDAASGSGRAFADSSQHLCTEPSTLQQQKTSSEMTALAEAIRDLEANTAALQLPSGDLQAESCQSLQCSSGYGTMTNVSAGGSIETICTSSGEFEKLADALLESNFNMLDKYCTLPGKRPPVSKTQPTSGRPLSTTGMKVAKFPRSDQDALLLTSSGPHQELLPPGDYMTTSSHVDEDDVMAFPPPPPAQLLNEQEVIGVDSDDEFPLPPPPDEEITTPQTCQGVWPLEPVNRYPSVMHSASVKMADRGSVQMRAGPPVAAKQYRVTVAEQSVSHATAAIVGKSSSVETNLLSQIHRGVSLRRTVGNDRSAPRIPGKR